MCSQLTLRLRLVGKRLEASSAYVSTDPRVGSLSGDEFPGPVDRGISCRPAESQALVWLSPPLLAPTPTSLLCTHKLQKSMEGPKAPTYVGNGWNGHQYFVLSSSLSSLGSWRPRCLGGTLRSLVCCLIHQRRLLTDHLCARKSAGTLHAMSHCGSSVRGALLLQIMKKDIEAWRG